MIKLAILHLTWRCNLKCKHCFSNAKGDELKTDKAIELIDVLWDNGIEKLNFSGGEFLLRNDWPKIFDYAIKKDFRIYLQTNGTTITREVANNLEEALVFVSLDYLGKKHDNLRGKEKTFEKAIQALNYLKNPWVRSTVFNDNVEDLKRIIDMVCENEWGFAGFIFVPLGHGASISDRVPDAKMLKEVYEYALEKSNFYSKIVVRDFYFFLKNKERFEKRKKRFKKFGYCPAGRFRLSIDPLGNVNPCPYIPIKAGNITKDDIDTIITRTMEISEKIRKIKIKKCYGCKHINICKCGCLAHDICIIRELNLN
ncbi:MAG: radical SAM/SPASM domain-containing protein [Candidatus Hydrothermarchaeota archaeon]